MPRADWTFIGNVRLSIPPIPEQNEILACIDRASKPLVDAMRRANDEITLIREYRARLISDVVTGQIDVRNWTPDPGDTLAEDDPMALAEISESDANEEEVEPD